MSLSGKMQSGLTPVPSSHVHGSVLCPRRSAPARCTTPGGVPAVRFGAVPASSPLWQQQQQQQQTIVFWTKKAKHIVQISVRARDGEEVTLSHDGAAATRALCLICLEEVSTLRGLACPEGHLICSACLQRYICSLAGSAKLRSSNGALDCLGAHQQAFSFGRSMVEPLLFGDALRLYLETMETPETPETTRTTETPGEGEEQCTPESIQPELHEALNLGCPSCEVFCDPDPDGCIAMKCSSCDVAFCWLCFQPCGRDAHPHCREVHGGFFPPRTVVNQWHRRLRWRQVDRVVQRAFGERPAPKLAVVIASKRKEAWREEALRLCAGNLADSEIRLWPFPTVEPSVGGMLEVVPHVQAAQFGRIDELRALLDNMPELIDQANDRGMTALMAAAHGGHAAVVTMLLERGADVTCRDDRGVSALDYAIRENKQEVARALLDCGAKVDALKKGLNIESATMLAKIGAEKGIMLSGMTRDQTEADFSNQGLQSADAILIGSDLKLMAVLTTLRLDDTKIGAVGAKVIAEALKVSAVLKHCNLLKNNLDIESATMLAKIGTEKGILFSGMTRDQTEADFSNQGLQSADAILIGSDLKLMAVLTTLRLDDTKIGAVGAKVIAEALKVSAVLKHCNLLKNNLDIESATMLAKIGTEKGILFSGMTRDQTEADFSNQGLQSADAILIGSDLKLMAVLTTLDLSVNRIGDEGAKAIAEALKVIAVLTSVDLRVNSIGDDGAKAIAEALKVNAVLKNLSVAYNSNIVGVAAQQLAAAALGSLSLEVLSGVPIKELREGKLTELNLISKGLGPTEGIVLAELIKFSAVVTTLVLGSFLFGNNIGDEGAKAIAEALKVNEVVTKLWLNNNKIGDDGAKAIAEALKVNAVLNKLYLQYNSNMGDAGEKALRDAVMGRSEFVLEL